MKKVLFLFIVISYNVLHSQVGAIHTTRNTGTLSDVPFTMSGLVNGGLGTEDFSGDDYSAAPLSANQGMIIFRANSNWQIDFAIPDDGLPIQNFRIYCFNFRGSRVQFNQPFTILSGSENFIAESGNILKTTQFSSGIIEFTNPVVSVSATFLSGGGTSSSSVGMTFGLENEIITEIPDTNFEQDLINQGIDSDGVINGKVFTSDINTITSLDVRFQNIVNMAGIEGFTALEVLQCQDNDITTIDISNNLNLRAVYCDRNEITTLNVSTLTDLRLLRAFNNDLESIDVSSNLLLKNLDVRDNAISSIDLAANTQLEKIKVDDNTLLETLDLTANTLLTEITVNDTAISSLNLATNTQLEKIQANSTLLETLDLTANTLLTEITVNNNANLTALSVKNGNNATVTIFNATGNTNLTCIQIDDASAAYLTTLPWVKDAVTSFNENCYYDYINTNVPDDNFETYLETHNANGDVVVVGDATSMGNGILNDNYVLTENINQITSLNVSNKSIADATGIEDFIALETLTIDNNQLTDLDVTSLSNLINLKANDNSIDDIDLTQNLSLQELELYNNILITLDLSQNTVVEVLSLGGNNLTTLDVSNNTEVTLLLVHQNNLETINAKNGNNTKIAGNLDFDATGNENLTCILVDDPAWSSANWLISLPQGASYNEFCPEFHTYVPDDKFEIYLEIHNANGGIVALGDDTSMGNGVIDDYVLTNNINTVNTLSINNKGIFDYTGIEGFLALNNLFAGGNNAVSINLSQNINLVELNLNYNNLTTIDVRANINLEKLFLYKNNISQLDLSQNTQLENIFLSDNNLTALNLSNNVNLKLLSLVNNNLVALNFQNGNNTNVLSFNALNNPNLTCIQVDDAAYSTANWTDIDAQASFSEDCNYIYTDVPDDNFEQALIDLGYDDILDDQVLTSNINSITTLDVSNKGIADATGIGAFISLNTLNFSLNSITELPIEDLLDLQFLFVTVNNLSAINLTTLTNLRSLDISNNQLTSLDVSNNPEFFLLNASNNTIASIDVSNNLLLEDVSVQDNILTSLDVSNNTELNFLRAHNNNLQVLNLKNGNNTNLSSSLSMTAFGNPDLTCIQVDDVAYSTATWTSIDAQSSFSEDCDYYTYVPDDNFEQALIDLGYDDVLDNEVITTNINTLTTLNVSNKGISDATGIEDFIALISLNFSGNSLTALDISQNTQLVILTVNDNNLSILDLTNNQNLEIIFMSNNDLILLNVVNGNNTAITVFDAQNNPDLTCIQVDDAAYSTANWTQTDAQTSFSEDCFDSWYTYVPDNNFEEFLIGEGYDDELDDHVLTANINTITSLIMPSIGVSNATGIEDFVALEELNLNANQLTSINLSNNTALIELNLNTNQLTSIILTNNVALKELSLSYNNITAIDVSHNVLLEKLLLQFNNIETIDVSTNTLLKNLDIANNLLTTIDVSANTLLTRLKVSDNLLTTIDVSGNPVLDDLEANNCNLNSLNVKNGNNINFTRFEAIGNSNLTCIQVDDATWSAANWTDIDPQASFSEDCFSAWYTHIPDDNFETYLETHDVNGDVVAVGDATSMGNGILNDDYVLTSNINSITTLNVSNSGITDATGLEDFTALEILNIKNNQLTVLDIASNVALLSLNCDNNELTNLDIGANINLKVLNCVFNQLNVLDTSTNVALENLRCNENPLTNIDVSNNGMLRILRAFRTNITSLDLSNNPNLEQINLNSSYYLTALNIKNGNNTNITLFQAVITPNLTCIQVDDAAYSTANWTLIDNEQTNFNEFCDYPIFVSPKVYLQGAYTNPNTGEELLMRDDLRVGNLIPTTSPYDSTTCDASVFTITGADAIVDWVLVELRNPIDNTTIITSQSALLQRDGDIVAIDGTSPVAIGATSGDYYVAIKHRNHLGVLSSNTITLSTSTTIVDLSSSTTAATGNALALRDMGNGIYAMYAGDATGDGNILNTDISNAINASGSINIYTGADTNMDGNILNTDIQLIIQPNAGRIQQF